MKIYKVRAEKRNHQYVSCDYVAENAVESYKEHVQSFYTKPLLFDVRDEGMELDPTSTMTTMVYTKNGLAYHVGVR